MHRWTPDLSTASWQKSKDADKTCKALEDGKLVAVPTETVYGLAADATNGKACAGIYAAKGRPSFNPLISHVQSFDAACEHGIFDAAAVRLAKAFWPGPLTLVVAKHPSSPISDLATAGLDSVALRVPAGHMMRFLCETTGKPLAAPSANRSGKISPTSAEDVIYDLGDKVDVVVDTGRCPVGVESTIVGLIDETPVLLRPGGVPREDIEAVLGRKLLSDQSKTQPNAPVAPGMLTSHYAPDSKMVLNADAVLKEDALLSFGPERVRNSDQAVQEFNLSPSGDLSEAAANLFEAMRTLDRSGAKRIAVQHIPNFGLGEAINDRLKRAAAPRPTE